MLLLDDVSSELDPERTEAVAFVLGNRGQMFVTTTRPDLFRQGCSLPPNEPNFGWFEVLPASQPESPQKPP